MVYPEDTEKAADKARKAADDADKAAKEERERKK